jgi:hypothetical protein
MINNGVGELQKMIDYKRCAELANEKADREIKARYPPEMLKTAEVINARDEIMREEYRARTQEKPWLSQ